MRTKQPAENNDISQKEIGLRIQNLRKTPGGITDPEYSISVGIQALADCLSMAGAEGPEDIEGISLALQGYNFGSGYISWALRNYGGYSELNALEFSDMMARHMGWPSYGDPQYVSHVLRYYSSPNSQSTETFSTFANTTTS